MKTDISSKAASGGVSGIFASIGQWLSAQRALRALALMDEQALKDIGLYPCDVDAGRMRALFRDSTQEVVDNSFKQVLQAPVVWNARRT